MQDIERDELQRFAVRLRVARRLVGAFLLCGLGFYLLSVIPVLLLREWWLAVVTGWYGMTESRWELVGLLYLAGLKAFYAGVLLPLWLGICLAGRRVQALLAAG